MRLRVELDVIFEKYVHVTQLGTNLKNVTSNNHVYFVFRLNVYLPVQNVCTKLLNIKP